MTMGLKKLLIKRSENERERVSICNYVIPLL